MNVEVTIITYYYLLLLWKELFWNIFFVLDVRRQTGHEPNGRQNPQTSANVRTGLRQERYLKSLIPSNELQV